MPRYIDTDKLIAGRVSNDPIVIAVNEEPSADVAEVKRGRWIFYEGYCMCSLCKKLFCTDSNYCGYCGAKMEGEA